MSMVVNIYQSLGRLTEAISNLKDDTKSNSEKIEELIQWTIAIPNLERDVAKNTKDLNELGRRHDRDIKELEKVAHTAKTLGQIALSGIGVAVLVYLYRHFTALLLSHP
jgi:predicted RNase H-like nuclease (RuvC/YqgF family)